MKWYLSIHICPGKKLNMNYEEYELDDGNELGIIWRGE
jgi:hypothetical protein